MPLWPVFMAWIWATILGGGVRPVSEKSRHTGRGQHEEIAMANMSYCRHENTSSDLRDVLTQWDDWVEEHESDKEPSYESVARRHIMAQVVAFTRAP